MSNLLFSVPSVAPYYVIVEQSDTLDSEHVEVFNQLYSECPYNEIVNKISIISELIDITKYRWVYFATASGVLSRPFILPPSSAHLGLGVLSVNLALWDSLGMQPIEGSALTAVSVVLPFSSGSYVGSAGPWVATTDVNGQASLYLPLGIKIKVNLTAAGIHGLVIDEVISFMNLADYI